jgi:hypothetical protein
MLRALSVRFEEHVFVVDLDDGSAISVQLKWFERLEHAAPKQLSEWRLSGDSEGIHWPSLDEDISVAALADAARMAAAGYQIGFDDDDPDKHQFVHICEKYPGKALCNSSRLWFHGETMNARNIAEVDCPECLVLWESKGK